MKLYCEEILDYLEKLIKEERSKIKFFYHETKKLKFLEKLYFDRILFLEKLIDEEIED